MSEITSASETWIAGKKSGGFAGSLANGASRCRFFSEDGNPFAGLLFPAFTLATTAADSITF